MVHLTPEELLAILKTARARSARDWTMILLAYRHGLRASEVCDLKMADVDLKAGSLSIRRLKGSLHIVQTLYRHKGQPLLDELAALRSWLRKRQPDGFHLRGGPGGQQLCLHLAWPPSRLLHWAQSVGPATAQLFTAILESKPHPEMGYRSCLGILRLGQRYSNQRLEAAAVRAVSTGACSYRSVKSILQRGLDRQPLEAPVARPPLEHSNVRGACYFDPSPTPSVQ